MATLIPSMYYSFWSANSIGFFLLCFQLISFAWFSFFMLIRLLGMAFFIFYNEIGHKKWKKGEKKEKKVGDLGWKSCFHLYKQPLSNNKRSNSAALPIAWGSLKCLVKQLKLCQVL